MLDLQMEVDILKETINVLKKDPGVYQRNLKNREKAVIIDAMKSKHSLPNLCRKLKFPKSSYYIKTEMFYGRNWDECSVDEFIQEVDSYMHWYCTERIKSTLGGLSPLDYRRSIGVGA